MKRNLLFIFVILLISSCSYETKNEKGVEKKYEQMLQKALNSTEREDTIYLGLIMGMTEKEVESHLKKLSKENKVYKNKYENFYKSNLSYKKLDYTLTLIPEYYHGKLVRLVCPIDNRIGVSDHHVIICSMFKEANPNYDYIIKTDVMGNNSYVASCKNLMVIFENVTTPMMIYEDAPNCKLLAEEMIRQDSIEHNKQLENF